MTWETESGCQTFQWFRHIILCVSQLVVMSILVLRTYALYGCSRKVFVGFGGLMLGIATVFVYFLSVSGKMLFQLLSSQNWQLPPSQNKQRTNGFACIAEGAISPYACAHSRATLLPRNTAPVSISALVFAFDFLVLALTVWKTYGTAKEMRSISGRLSLVTLMFRDGSLYFFIMALAHLANLTPFDYAILMDENSGGPRQDPFVSRGEAYLSGSFSVFANCLSVTLISRLMLNLHDAAHAGVLLTGADASASIISGIICRDIPTHHSVHRLEDASQNVLFRPPYPSTITVHNA
ncbi:hypothetical protein PLICRDRAFT_38957 [Plicaturopsis crispa FD-325 SS-3]|nr:hypothetical protein PLICRDRAFT_38957 [Plicaturopsis crispa FD-325 SS-3]